MLKVRLILIFSGLLAAGLLRGQQATFTVLDKKTEEPVAYAHVSFEPVNGGEVIKTMTNEQGQVNNLADKESIMGVSFVGYKTLFDTISPNEGGTIYLSPTVLNIDEVVVTAQFTPERADKSIYKINVLNSQQIERKAASSLDELIDQELNIRVTQDAVLGTGMSLQGLSGEHVKFLIDGVPVIGRLNGAIDISQLNLYNVDHIEVIEGPMSVVYGSNAMAGVVNIITKENTNYRSYTNLHGYVESVGTYNFDGSTSLGYRDHVFQVSGGRNFFSGYKFPGDKRSYTFKPKRKYFFDGSYILNKESVKLNLSTSYFNELLLDKGELKQPYFYLAQDNHFNTTRFSTKADVGVKLASHRYLSVLGSYSLFDRRRENYYKDLSELSENLVDADTTRFYSYMLRSTFSKSNENSRFNYQLGVDLNLEEGSGEKIEGTQREIGDYAAFLSIKYKPFDMLVLQPGLRYIYNTKYDAPLVYSMNLKVDPIKRLTLRSSYAIGFRAPSLKELYLDFVDVNHKIYGNPDLLAETADNFNASALYHADREKHVYEAELSYFYNKIENSIMLVVIAADGNGGFNPADGPPPYTYRNLGHYATKGFQLALNYSFYPNLKIKTGVNHITSIIGESHDAQQQSATSTDYNATLNYTIVKYDLNVSLYYKYNGELPIFSLNEDDEVLLRTLSDYQTMDLTIGKSFLENSLNLSTGVKNIFGNKVIPVSNSNQGGIHTGGGSGSLIGYGRVLFMNASYTIKYLK